MSERSDNDIDEGKTRKEEKRNKTERKLHLIRAEIIKVLPTFSKFRIAGSICFIAKD